MVRAWARTFGLPCLITNCSNNYGPFQFPEKLIPLTILNALAGEPLPVYGKGENVRDWLFVDDHVDGLLTVLQRGRVGETYVPLGELLRGVGVPVLPSPEASGPPLVLGPEFDLIRLFLAGRLIWCYRLLHPYRQSTAEMPCIPGKLNNNDRDRHKPYKYMI